MWACDMGRRCGVGWSGWHGATIERRWRRLGIESYALSHEASRRANGTRASIETPAPPGVVSRVIAPLNYVDWRPTNNASQIVEQRTSQVIRMGREPIGYGHEP